MPAVLCAPCSPSPLCGGQPPRAALRRGIHPYKQRPQMGGGWGPGAGWAGHSSGDVVRAGWLYCDPAPTQSGAGRQLEGLDSPSTLRALSAPVSAPHPSVWVARLGVPWISLSWAGCRGLRRCLGTSAVQGPAVWGRAPPAPGVSPGPRRQQATVCLRSLKPVACGLTGLPSRSLSPLWSGDGGAWGAGDGRVGGPALWGVDVEAGERGAGSSARAGLRWCRAPRTGRAGTVWSRP